MRRIFSAYVFLLALFFPAVPRDLLAAPAVLLLPQSPASQPPLVSQPPAYPPPPGPLAPSDHPPPAGQPPGSSKRGLVLFSSVIVSCIGAAIVAVLVVWCYLERRRYGAVGRIRFTQFRHPRIPMDLPRDPPLSLIPLEPPPRDLPRDLPEVRVSIPPVLSSPSSPVSKGRCSITRHATHS